MSNKLTYIVVLSLLVCGCKSSYQHLADTQINYMQVGVASDTLGADSDVKGLINPYKEDMEAQMNTILGELPEDLVKKRPSSNMGNWFCDALLYMAQEYSDKPVDFAIQNYGGLRLPFLGKGPITKSDIYELMPFDNQLMIVELNQNMLSKLLDDIADSGGWPISKGVEFRIDNDKAVDIKIKGKRIEANKTYYAAIPDYIANGWGGQPYLAECNKINSNIYVRDVIIEYLSVLQAKNEDIIIDSSKRIY